MASRYHPVRFGALVLAAAAALLVSASPAVAQTTGTFIGDVEPGEGFNVKADGGGTREVWAALLGIDTDGNLATAELRTYCVEIDVQARAEADMVEAPWSEFPGDTSVAKPDKVLWILHNSYPSVSVDDLKAASGVDGLTNREAITGTQAAIWHFANGAELADNNDDDIIALYDYLTGDANVGLEEREPVSLSLTPEDIADLDAGTRAGPFTVQTTADVATLSVDGPDGVKVVDEAGNDLESVANGGTFWLTAPDGGIAGEATVKAVAEEPHVAKGRLFVGAAAQDNQAQDNQPLGFSNSGPGLFSDEKRTPARTQTLVVADSTKSTARDEAAANWLATPPPTTTTTTTPPAPTTTTVAPTTVPPVQGGGLPNTGASVMTALVVGVILLGVGGGILLLVQRRRGSAS